MTASHCTAVGSTVESDAVDSASTIDHVLIGSGHLVTSDPGIRLHSRLLGLQLPDPVRQNR